MKLVPRHWRKSPPGDGGSGDLAAADSQNSTVPAAPLFVEFGAAGLKPSDAFGREVDPAHVEFLLQRHGQSRSRPLTADLNTDDV